MLGCLKTGIKMLRWRKNSRIFLSDAKWHEQVKSSPSSQVTLVHVHGGSWGPTWLDRQRKLAELKGVVTDAVGNKGRENDLGYQQGKWPESQRITPTDAVRLKASGNSTRRGTAVRTVWNKATRWDENGSLGHTEVWTHRPPEHKQSAPEVLTPPMMQRAASVPVLKPPEVCLGRLARQGESCCYWE